MSDVKYDIMLCSDGVTRAVEIVNGQRIDPSLKIEIVKEEKEEKSNKPKLTIQDRINEKVINYIGELEGKVDDFIASDFKMKFDCYQYLLDKDCKSVHARKLKDFYLDCYNELVGVYNGEDEELKEGWSHLKPKQLKSMMDFFGVIVDDMERLIKNASAQRKPRKSKPVLVSKLIKSLKYQKEFPKLKLVSINPEKIIGATELWVYNTKYNRLGVYYAKNTVRGFSVKGCTIKDFNEETSMQKTVRKPDDALSNLTKRSLKKKFKEMKTKEQVVTGRINSDTILLGAF